KGRLPLLKQTAPSIKPNHHEHKPLSGLSLPGFEKMIPPGPNDFLNQTCEPEGGWIILSGRALNTANHSPSGRSNSCCSHTSCKRDNATGTCCANSDLPKFRLRFP